MSLFLCLRVDSESDFVEFNSVVPSTEFADRLGVILRQQNVDSLSRRRGIFAIVGGGFLWRAVP